MILVLQRGQYSHLLQLSRAYESCSLVLLEEQLSLSQVGKVSQLCSFVGSLHACCNTSFSLPLWSVNKEKPESKAKHIYILGSLSNDDGDVNENGKKAIGLN